MANPVLEGRRAAMFFAGPDGPHKQTVERLVADLGFETLTAMEMGMGRNRALSVVRRET